MEPNMRLPVITGMILMSVLLVGNGTAATEYCSQDVPKDIPDDGMVTSLLTVPDSFIIKDVNVVLYITHSYDADLDVYLIFTPDQNDMKPVEVELFSDVGPKQANFKGTILDDEADLPIDSNEAHAQYEGPHKPMGNLTDFDGLDPSKGTWQLRIIDDSSVDVGVLHSWCLIIEECVPPPEPADPEPVDGATNQPLDICLSWNGAAELAETTWDLCYWECEDVNSMVCVSDLSEPNYCPDSFQPSTQYCWQIVAKNPCKEEGTEGPTWHFSTTGPPVARTKDLVVVPGMDCQADVGTDDIDGGSSDPDGDAITLTMDPAGPFEIGQHEVALTVTDDKGLSDSNTATVTVLQTAWCYKIEAIGMLEALDADPNDPNTADLAAAIEHIEMSLGVVWAGPDRIAKWQGGYYVELNVFDHQEAACDLLKAYEENTGVDTEPARRLLAEADKRLAEMAIWAALFHGCDDTIIAEAKALKNEADRAVMMGDICSETLAKYEEAWQLAIDCLGPDVDVNRDGKVDMDDFMLFIDEWLASASL